MKCYPDSVKMIGKMSLVEGEVLLEVIRLCVLLTGFNNWYISFYCHVHIAGSKSYQSVKPLGIPAQNSTFLQSH